MSANRVEVILSGKDELSPVINKAISGINSAGRSLTQNVTGPIVGAGVAIATVAGSFEQEMNRVKALTQTSGEEFESLRNLAKELGSETRFSASEAAASMSFLGATGYDAGQILSALPKTLTLAAATSTDLAKTGNILTNILSGYRLEAEDAAWATDVLAKAFTSRNLGTDLTSLGKSLEYVGPVARSSNLAFEETVAILGALGQGGIQASAAGTALRGMISALESPVGRGAKAIERLGIVTHDAGGQLRPITQIIDDLAASGATSADVIDLFGRRGAAAANILLAEGGEALRDFQKELELVGGTGFADDLAAQQSEGFNGALRSMRSALEGLVIEIADSGLLDFLTSVVNKATAVIRQLTQTNPEILRIGTIIAATVAAVGPALIIIGSIASGVGAIASAVGLFGPAFVAVATAIATLGAPVLAVIAGIAGAGYAIYANWERLGPLFNSVGSTFMAAMTPLREPLQILFEQLKKLGLQVWEIAQVIGGAFAKVLKMASTEGSVLNGIVMNFAGLIGTVVSFALKNLIATGNNVIRIVRGLASAFLFVAKHVGNLTNNVGDLINRLRGISPAAEGLRSITGGTAAALSSVTAGITGGRVGGAASGYTPATSAGRALNSAIGTAATGLLPGGPIGALLGAAIQERRQAPAGSRLIMANDSEAILTRPQQESLASAIAKPPTFGEVVTNNPSQIYNNSSTFAPVINVYGVASSTVNELADEVMNRIEERFREYQAGFLT